MVDPKKSSQRLNSDSFDKDNKADNSIGKTYIYQYTINYELFIFMVLNTYLF